MNRRVTSFRSQRKAEDLCLFWSSISQSGVFLPAPNRGEGLFFEDVRFKSILPSFGIFITGRKREASAISRRTLPLWGLCQQTYLFYAVVHNFYLLVQLLLQICFDAIAQQKTHNCKDDYHSQKISGFCAVSKSIPSHPVLIAMQRKLTC